MQFYCNSVCCHSPEPNLNLNSKPGSLFCVETLSNTVWHTARPRLRRPVWRSASRDQVHTKYAVRRVPTAARGSGVVALRLRFVLRRHWVWARTSTAQPVEWVVGRESPVAKQTCYTRISGFSVQTMQTMQTAIADKHAMSVLCCCDLLREMLARHRIGIKKTKNKPDART